MDDAARKKLLTRLRRVEGQVSAIRRMVEDDRDCVDVLLQIQAARGALGRAGEVLLENYVRTCVQYAFDGQDTEARDEKIEELIDVFARYSGGRS
ncbi:MAG: DNA-binding FrmR family transcriptional regulator [Myxococcota bacterium]|jgi:DNA-binding FrmR family transcriptional regulator